MVLTTFGCQLAFVQVHIGEMFGNVMKIRVVYSLNFAVI